MDLRCPQCDAKLRGRELWCSLCHADLRPKAVAEPVAPDPLTAPVEVDPLTAPVEELLAAQADLQPVADRPRGKHAHPRDPDADDEPLVDPEVMLAMLRADSQDPVLSKVGGRMGDPTARFVVMVGGTVLLAALLFAVYALLGVVVA